MVRFFYNGYIYTRWFFNKKSNYDVIVIGASTGGPTAIERIVTKLPSNLPIPVIGESESGARTMSLDFTGVTSAGFKEVTIFANDGNSSGESIFEAIIPSNITLTENYRTYVVSGTKKQNMQPGTTYLIVADSITDIEDFRNRLGQTTYNLIKRINEGSFF